jgi:hypothetical protein
MLTKVSIYIFYLHLLPQQRIHALVWILFGITVTYGMVYNLLSIFACKPVAATWNLALMPEAKCVDVLTKYMVLSVLNIIIDVLTVVLPIPVVLKLQMPFRRKLSVILVVMTGVLYVPQ